MNGRLINIHFVLRRLREYRHFDSPRPAFQVVLIFVMLYLDFRNVRLSLLVLLSVPLACIGGVAAVLLTGGSISLGSLVGFVTVFGIAVRNGIC